MREILGSQEITHFRECQEATACEPFQRLPDETCLRLVRNEQPPVAFYGFVFVPWRIIERPVPRLQTRLHSANDLAFVLLTLQLCRGGEQRFHERSLRRFLEGV
ncbi:MAG: hypothetical protein V1926_02540 [Candidatus Peregrinibacteria bacterium]